MPILWRRGACAGQNTQSTQGAAAHPAIGASPAGGHRWYGQRTQASLRGCPRGRIVRCFCSQDGSVLGLGPFVTLTFRRGGRSSFEHRTCVTSLASQLGGARSGVESPFARRPSTGALRGFLLRVPDGSSDGKPRTKGQATGRRGGPKVASRGVSHRGEPRGARHAAGTRRHLPWGSFPFGEISSGERDALVYLANAFRPQGFSPSRRFAPTGAVWLCFAPLPPIGFWPSELFPLNQPRRLSTPVALVPLSQRQPRQVSPLRPSPLPSSSPPFCLRSCRNSHPGVRDDIKTVADISHETRQRTSELNDERPTPALKRQPRTPGRASTGSASVQRSTTPSG